jgi:hypothetical protein
MNSEQDDFIRISRENVARREREREENERREASSINWDAVFDLIAILSSLGSMGYSLYAAFVGKWPLAIYLLLWVICIGMKDRFHGGR